jgi:hypothetical protein
VHEYGVFPSRENFERFIGEQEEAGDRRWASRTHEAWWNLVQGAPGLGGWDYRTDPEVREAV